ncbi:copper amine oxidase N-terminal domain-containing protein [Paenibacillus sp. GSMTC-2017]|uniref:copper amine oxidase N-terminal domain-containing protein n=1 Tax=Paenibacillus sp. GSMTC-2017 TaxID=2794350 RepID=UPI0018D7FC4D|nr:copper amine oxidase N-terminal domain-containing protein [Paenibacillus sp. GSMTC-2017]MBH5319204.1 copper amine oxidase N-terminal domain-containing protein [Paenibacillus sp. GSMTC-2017]
MLLLALTLLIVAGCQSVGGLDLNKTLKNVLKVTSSESKQSVEFQLHMNDEFLEENDEEYTELIKLLSHVTVQLDNVKLQDASHVSMEGSLKLGKEIEIGFDLQANDKALVIDVDGAKAPFTFDLTGEKLLEMSGLTPEEIEEATPTSTLSNESMTKIGKEIIDIVGEYGINNLPNPTNIKVSPVNEPINGINTSLMHVQASLNGTELLSWVKSYVDALVNDRAGLDAMVSGIIKVLAANPDIWASIGEVDPFNTGELDAMTQDEFAKESSNAIAEMLVMLQEEIESFDKSEDESMKEVFTKDLVLKTDFYVDSNLDIRKQQVELSFKPEATTEDELLPFIGFTLKATSEQWNINGAVKADAPVVTDDHVAVEDLISLQGYQTLKLFDEKSAIYDLLKNKLHIAKQSYMAFSDDYYNAPIIMPGYVTMVAARDVADVFGATTTYDPATKKVTIYDEATDTTIIIQSGSSTAVINGKKVDWKLPVMNFDGSLYVPARKFAEALGADIKWETLEEIEAKILTIEREL